MFSNPPCKDIVYVLLCFWLKWQKGPQPLPLRGHGGSNLLFLGVVCVGVPFQRFKWLSAVSAFDCFPVLVTTQQHRSVVWLRGPQKTRARPIGLGRLPDRPLVDRGGLRSRQVHHQGGHPRLRRLRGEAFEQVLPHGDAGTRTLPIREAIRRLFRLFTLAVKEGHLELLGISRYWEPSASEEDSGEETDEVEFVAFTAAVDLTSLQAEHLVPRSRLWNPYVFDPSSGSSSSAAAPRAVPSRASSSVVDTPAAGRESALRHPQVLPPGAWSQSSPVVAS